ncbi:hypothetical protein, partial [Pantoea agglomerans]|uniref:hypothetical protein n=1 Tax=Enterobacter agglomerans TaxID=549 RepID=UPI001A8EF8D5
LLLIAHHLHFFHPGTDENHWQINAKSLPVESLLVTKNDQVVLQNATYRTPERSYFSDFVATRTFNNMRNDS